MNGKLFMELCEHFPADVHGGDPVTAEVVRHIISVADSVEPTRSQLQAMVDYQDAQIKRLVKENEQLRNPIRSRVLTEKEREAVRASLRVKSVTSATDAYEFGRKHIQRQWRDRNA